MDFRLFLVKEEGSASRVDVDTLLVMDETDIQKPYARSMEGLARVRECKWGNSSFITLDFTSDIPVVFSPFRL